jgi:ABC-type multidrug transport system ATPase subunit
MQVNFKDAQRSFGAQMVFDKLNHRFLESSRTAVLGGNGSGKSTLLKCLYGALSLSQGDIQYLLEGKNLSAAEAVSRISFSGPYFELIEELGAREFLETYQRFRNLSLAPDEILRQSYLEKSASKKIKQFSSGMKQRLRLSLAIFSVSDLVILDEPTANLDPKGIDWYQETLQENLGKRSLVIGSNFSKDETFYCQDELKVADFAQVY